MSIDATLSNLFADGLKAIFSAPSDAGMRRRFYITQVWFGTLILVLSISAFVAAPLIDSIIFPKYRISEAYYFAAAIAFLISILATFGAGLQLFLEFGQSSISVRHLSPPTATTDAQSETLPKPSIDRPRPARHELIASSIRSRLKAEIRDQGRKANTNLTMGVLTALLGLAFLAWLAWDTTTRDFTTRTANGLTTPITPMIYWGQFAAKVTLSVSANAFSLFFLSTYRRNLTEIKYFQNELTNVDLKLISVFMAGQKNFSDIQKKLLISLSEVERNFILRKGETTADLQLKSLDAVETATLAALLSEIGERLPSSVASAKAPANRKPRAAPKA